MVDGVETRILKIDALRPELDRLREAADVIRRGGLVVFPTETVYGLGADAYNRRAVERIFKAKERPMDNPLIVHICEVEDLERLAVRLPE